MKRLIVGIAIGSVLALCAGCSSSPAANPPVTSATLGLLTKSEAAAAFNLAFQAETAANASEKPSGGGNPSPSQWSAIATNIEHFGESLRAIRWPFVVAPAAQSAENAVSAQAGTTRAMATVSGDNFDDQLKAVSQVGVTEAAAENTLRTALGLPPQPAD